MNMHALSLCLFDNRSSIDVHAFYALIVQVHAMEGKK